MKRWLWLFCFWQAMPVHTAEVTAKNSFTIELDPPPAPTALLSDSPFGINNAFHPDTADLDSRLAAIQQAGIKWGRQDFTWRRIEKQKGEYDWRGYDELVEKCRMHGLLIFGNLSYQPAFYDLRSEEAATAYATFAGPPEPSGTPSTNQETNMTQAAIAVRGRPLMVRRAV